MLRFLGRHMSQLFHAALPTGQEEAKSKHLVAILEVR